MYDRKEIVHVERLLGGQKLERFARYLKGPMWRDHRDFGVATFRPRRTGGAWLYLSTAVPREGHPDRSFFLVADRPDRRHVETLTMLSHRQISAGRAPVQRGTVVDIGRGWVEGSSLDHLLITQPHPFGHRLKELSVEEEGFEVLWAQPITGKEARFAHVMGPDELERRLVGAQVKWAQVDRLSVV